MKHWLEDIYRDHRRGLFGLALSVIREAASAEDAVHEAFARMAKQALAPSGDAVSYAYRAVRNAAIDQLRRRQTRPTTSSQAATLFLISVKDDPARAAENNEMQKMLMQSIDNLPDTEREVVVMRSFGGLSFKQIAQATGQPISTVSSQYQRALTRLRQVMETHHATA